LRKELGKRFVGASGSRSLDRGTSAICWGLFSGHTAVASSKHKGQLGITTREDQKQAP